MNFYFRQSYSVEEPEKIIKVIADDIQQLEKELKTNDVLFEMLFDHEKWMQTKALVARGSNGPFLVYSTERYKFSVNHIKKGDILHSNDFFMCGCAYIGKNLRISFHAKIDVSTEYTKRVKAMLALLG